MANIEGRADSSAAVQPLGLIGVGRWGQVCLRTLLDLRSVKLAAVASTNPQTKALVPKSCRIYPSWRELLASGSCTGVIIATPPASHAEIIAAAIADGVHVFVEKPLCLSVVEADSLVDVAHAGSVTVMVDHVILFHAAFSELKRLVAELGEPLAIHAKAGNYGPVRKDVPVMWDWGAHDVAMCLDLLGEKEVYTLFLRRLAGQSEFHENLEFGLGFAGGVRATIEIGNRMSKVRTFAVECSGGTVVFDDVGAETLSICRAGVKELVPVATEPPLTAGLRLFVSAIQEQARDLTGLRLGRDVVRVLTELDRLRLQEQPGAIF